MKRTLIAAACAFAGIGPAVAGADVIFSENFDGLPLQPKFEEPVAPTPADRPVWTDVPPSGWVRDDSGVPGDGDPATDGIGEWSGWAFADRAWWGTVDPQGRQNFNKSTGNLMVADNDEWDDGAHPPFGSTPDTFYNTRMTTRAISLAGVQPGSTMTLDFDSSWRAECCDDGGGTNNQNAVVTAVYSDGTRAEVLNWSSDAFDANFHDDNVNEDVTLTLPARAGADSVRFEFAQLNAGNDWWWAVDNVSLDAAVVPEPASAALLGLLAVPLVARRRRRQA